MTQISNLLAKYKQTLRPPQASVEATAVAMITKVTGLQLTATQVSYTPASRTLRLQVPSVMRSELLRHKPAILAGLRADLGATHAPTDIR